MSIITIATDFGTVDGYAAAMKGVIRSITLDPEIIDVTHDLDSIMRSSIVLERYYSYYPAGTIHLVVVDPTVGSHREPLMGSDGKYLFVGPDNGIFTRVISVAPGSKWWAIDIDRIRQGDISPTFHGRDIFAPAAALLARGASPDELGAAMEDPIVLDIPEPVVLDDCLQGEIIDVDRFGNLITNIDMDLAGTNAVITIYDNQAIRLSRTYADVPVGTPLAYIGSLGYLEIGVNLGRADEYFAASTGCKVRISY